MYDSSLIGGELPAEPESAFVFEGEWREFLPIALTNLLLTLATLGIYRFWAKARERRYLWSRTRFIDDRLGWTGTGREMFLGFLIVFFILLPVLIAAQLAIEALTLRGRFREAGVLFMILYGGLFYLIGVGGFRALRYRLSRTWWHGIRGGSADGGWWYGWSYFWKYAVGWSVFALLVPWAMTSLWNDRWNRMSFGRHPFEAGAGTEGLIGRWLLVFLVPIGGMFVVFATVGLLVVGGSGETGAAVTFLATLVLFYLLFLLASLSYYAAFYRQVVAATSIAGLEFEFTARTKDWLKLILGNIALVVLTLGVGLVFLGYRNWSFAVRHMEASGEINLDTLLQSLTAATGDAEGLADAFDIGAI